MVLSATDADLIAFALQNLVAFYEASGNTQAGVSAFVLRGRILSHAAAQRRFNGEVSQFEEENRVSYIRKPR